MSCRGAVSGGTAGAGSRFLIALRSKPARVNVTTRSRNYRSEQPTNLLPNVVIGELCGATDRAKLSNRSARLGISAFGTKRTCQSLSAMSAFGGKADIGRRWVNVRF